MAAPMTKILRFPVMPASPPGTSPQLSAFPFGSSDTVIQHMEHELIRLYRLRSVLDPQQCLHALGELSLLAQCLDRIETNCKRTVERQAKAVGLIA